jgi:hypothetical protein
MSCQSHDTSISQAKPKLPFGVADMPKPGATARGSIAAGGWALFEAGVKEVCFYLDRAFVKCTAVSGKRPDVLKAYPNFAKNDTSGWDAIIETNSYSAGDHELTVQATDYNGSTKDIGVVSLMVVH